VIAADAGSFAVVVNVAMVASSTVRSVLASHHPVGASTGCFPALRGDWPAQVAAAREVSSYAAELSALQAREFEGLLAYLDLGPALPFNDISVHAPTKGLRAPAHLRELIDRLPLAIGTIVVHPDTLDDGDDLADLGPRVIVENMDGRKTFGRTADELADVFARLPDAGFCFDIAHAWSLDPSMGLAESLLDRFASRLREVHLSSLSPEGRHVALTDEHAALFAPLLSRCVDVPWILEAPVSES
jgi:hypothetical protein